MAGLVDPFIGSGSKRGLEEVEDEEPLPSKIARIGGSDIGSSSSANLAVTQPSPATSPAESTRSISALPSRAFANPSDRSQGLSDSQCVLLFQDLVETLAKDRRGASKAKLYKLFRNNIQWTIKGLAGQDEQKDVDVDVDVDMDMDMDIETPAEGKPIQPSFLDQL